MTHEERGPLPEPAGFRSRYRSEPGMIGHYPWTYADHQRRKYDRPECEYEDLFTRSQLDAEVESALASARQKHALETSAILSRLRDCQGVIMRMRDPAIQGGIDMERAIQECLAREVIK